MIKFYNSLKGKKEVFTEINPQKILIYVCGITAYDLCHIGHLRITANFDLIVRYLQHKGYQVKYVRNITDIDDKIINRAQEENKDFLEISRLYSAEMHKDFKAIGMNEPDFEPRATSYVKEMIALIKNLEHAGMTYTTSKGDLCYRVRNFPDYGKLSQKNIDELRTGARVAADESKEDPLDFVLWKAAKEGEPSWDSPWGKGRPGWHIECSTMVRCCLGPRIDIHGGGRDLIFPHHENEIAQSEAVGDNKLANYWLHCGHLMINGKKMSKSLNNFITIRDLMAKYSPEVIKYFIYSSHYRSQMDYSDEVMKQAQTSLENLYRTISEFPAIGQYGGGLSEQEDAFYAAMDDDCNTPLALSVLFELAKIIHKNKDERAVRSLIKCGKIIGIFYQDPQVFLKQGIYGSQAVLSQDAIDKIEKLVNDREEARKNNNWEKSDLLRDELTQLGIVIEDTKGGVKWRVVE